MGTWRGELESERPRAQQHGSNGNDLDVSSPAGMNLALEASSRASRPGKRPLPTAARAQSNLKVRLREVISTEMDTRAHRKCSCRQ